MQNNVDAAAAALVLENFFRDRGSAVYVKSVFGIK
jgi:RNase H-fold protein (predicted Holliday junction resolvase)